MSDAIRHDMELVLATGRGRVITPDISTAKEAREVAKQLRLIAKLLMLQAGVFAADEELERLRLPPQYEDRERPGGLPPAVVLPKVVLKLREDRPPIPGEDA